MIISTFIQSYSVPKLNPKTLRSKFTDVYISENYISDTNKAQKLVKECKDNNIKVHGWVFCFNRNGRWIDPSNQLTQEDIKNRIINLLHLPLNGIVLDYVRYPGTAYKYKNSQNIITNFVGSVRNLLPKTMELSVCVMPECSVNSYFYGQDYKTLSEYASIIPMAYKGNYKSDSSWIQSVTSYIHKQIQKNKLICAIQTYKSDENPTPLPLKELNVDISNAIGGGADGVALFHYDTITKEFFQDKKVYGGDNIAQYVDLPTFEDMLARYYEFIKREGRKPKYVSITRGSEKHVDLPTFENMLARYNEFIEEHNRKPLTISIVPPQKQEKADDSWTLTGYFKEDLQDTGYTCGPTSLSMALSALGCNVSEGQLARWAGTTTHGTTSSGMLQAVKYASQYCSIKLSAKNVSFKSTGWAKIQEHIKRGCEIVLHVLTYPYLAHDYKGNPVWKNNYGHFIYLVGVNIQNRLCKVADPSKGIKTFTFDQMEKAIKAVTWADSLYIICKSG